MGQLSPTLETRYDPFEQALAPHRALILPPWLIEEDQCQGSASVTDDDLDPGLARTLAPGSM
jgi:hypothetical protein